MLALRAHVLPVLLIAAVSAIGAPRATRHLETVVLRRLCVRPAPIYGRFDPRAPGYIVIFRRGMDGRAETEQLEADYGFSASWVWTITPGFSAKLDDDVRDRLRCDPAVEFIEHESVVQLENTASGRPG